MRRIAVCGSLLFALVSAWSLAACKLPPRDKKPFGELPEAVTSAEPLWIPYRVAAGKSYPADPREGRLLELRRITFDGKSSRPKWHPNSRRLLVEQGPPGCAALVEIDLASGTTARLAEGASSGGWAGDQLVFAKAATPPAGACGPNLAQGAAGWTYPEASIFLRGAHADPAKPAIASPGTDVEPAGGPEGLFAFTSTRDGDPELYLAHEGTVSRVTQRPGYDGGASLSADGTRVVWHAAPPRKAAPPPPPPSKGKAKKKDKRGKAGPAEAPKPVAPKADPAAIVPERLELWIAGSAGQHPRALGTMGRHDADPSFLPDARHIVFTSDYDAPPNGPATFDLYLGDVDGPATRRPGPMTERITFHAAYDGQATVSPDGAFIAFTSARAADGGPGTDVFVARWRKLDD